MRPSFIAAALAPLLLIGAWVLFAPDGSRSPAEPVTSDEPPAPPAPPTEEAPVPPSPQKVFAASQPAAERPKVEAENDHQHRAPDDGLWVVGPRSSDPHEPGMHPHPITDEHRHIRAINEVIQTLNDAMSIRDTKAMRAHVLEYEKLDPSDVDRSQLGYRLIADCIDYPGEASLAAARTFYANERHSPLRRFIRRICFENRN